MDLPVLPGTAGTVSKHWQTRESSSGERCVIRDSGFVIRGLAAGDALPINFTREWACSSWWWLQACTVGPGWMWLRVCGGRGPTMPPTSLTVLHPAHPEGGLPPTRRVASRARLLAGRLAVKASLANLWWCVCLLVTGLSAGNALLTQADQTFVNHVLLHRSAPWFGSWDGERDVYWWLSLAAIIVSLALGVGLSRPKAPVPRSKVAFCLVVPCLLLVLSVVSWRNLLSEDVSAGHAETMADCCIRAGLIIAAGIVLGWVKRRATQRVPA